MACALFRGHETLAPLVYGGTNVLMKDGELFMDHPTPKPLSFKAATSKQTGEKVHLHQLTRELETPLPDFLAPLVDLARKLEYNVTFL